MPVIRDNQLHPLTHVLGVFLAMILVAMVVLALAVLIVAIVKRVRMDPAVAAAMEPRSGDIYQHYKGGYYQALHLAEDAEDADTHVVYASLADHQVWSRRYSSFTESLVLGGRYQPRFRRVESNETYSI